ncbi:hypothetical protein L202_04255 [Cryptococcus amylolentus CBS 6039]|uniref:Uncharacterized protein n=1 Tax=Cryptococcus amylolentus CBS 6039 TaxID=1295533 RepID=A0A1E3HQM7_9TREE|nr:hypothetical protein L202_04255 [Cryptococcus amylolentus CBS 6039]ODN78673.1 hypothetical protein L202_04255 [Cryptococcus amylolentus CBS 6039]
MTGNSWTDNMDQFEAGKGFWEGVGEGEIVRRRADVVKSGQGVIGRWGKLGQERGIVLTDGHNKDTTLRTITTIKHLRGLGVSLPFQVFRDPGKTSNRKQHQAVEELGATLREANGLSKEPGACKIKGAALVDSSFRKSSTSTLTTPPNPRTSPVHLFEAPISTTSGRAAFWPDLTNDHSHNAGAT